jgi:hypothetical protein
LTCNVDPGDGERSGGLDGLDNLDKLSTLSIPVTFCVIVMVWTATPTTRRTHQLIGGAFDVSEYTRQLPQRHPRRLHGSERGDCIGQGDQGVILALQAGVIHMWSAHHSLQGGSLIIFLISLSSCSRICMSTARVDTHATNGSASKA